MTYYKWRTHKLLLLIWVLFSVTYYLGLTFLICGLCTAAGLSAWLGIVIMISWGVCQFFKSIAEY